MVGPVYQDIQARLHRSSACRYRLGSGQIQEKDAGSPQTQFYCDAVILGSIHSRTMASKGSCLLPEEHTEILDSVLELANWLYPCMENVETIPEHRNICSIARKYADLRLQLVGSTRIAKRQIRSYYHSFMENARVKSGLARTDPDTIVDWRWRLAIDEKSPDGILAVPIFSTFQAPSPVPTHSASGSPAASGSESSEGSEGSEGSEEGEEDNNPPQRVPHRRVFNPFQRYLSPCTCSVDFLPHSRLS